MMTSTVARLLENGEDGRIGEAHRITFAVVDVVDNVQGELCAHAVTVSELCRKKIARTIESIGHDPQSVGIIDVAECARWCHFALPPLDPARAEAARNAARQSFAWPRAAVTASRTSRRLAGGWERTASVVNRRQIGFIFDNELNFSWQSVPHGWRWPLAPAARGAPGAGGRRYLPGS
jgi:hypothetical protein